MRLQRRHLRPDDTDIELVFGVLFVPLLYAFGFACLLLPQSLLPRCALREHLGICCPTCGTYRAMGRLFRGDVTGAFRMQPLFTAAAVAGALFTVYSLWVTIGRRRRLRLEFARPRRAAVLIGTGILAAVLLNWLYLLRAGG